MNNTFSILLLYIPNDNVLLLDEEQEQYLKRALEYYFNIADFDQNGVITYPEFTTMALKFYVDEEMSQEDMVILYIDSLLLKSILYYIHLNITASYYEH